MLHEMPFASGFFWPVVVVGWLCAWFEGAGTRGGSRKATVCLGFSLPKSDRGVQPSCCHYLLPKIDLGGGGNQLGQCCFWKNEMIDWHAPSSHRRGLEPPKTLQSNVWIWEVVCHWWVGCPKLGLGGFPVQAWMWAWNFLCSIFIAPDKDQGRQAYLGRFFSPKDDFQKTFRYLWRFYSLLFRGFFVALFCLEKQCSGLFRYFFVAFSWPLFWAKFTRTRPGTVFWDLGGPNWVPEALHAATGSRGRWVSWGNFLARARNLESKT